VPVLFGVSVVQGTNHRLGRGLGHLVTWGPRWGNLILSTLKKVFGGKNRRVLHAGLRGVRTKNRPDEKHRGEVLGPWGKVLRGPTKDAPTSEKREIGSQICYRSFKSQFGQIVSFCGSQ